MDGLTPEVASFLFVRPSLIHRSVKEFLEQQQQHSLPGNLLIAGH